jgi:chemotaxis protein histidine kinase CheA
MNEMDDIIKEFLVESNDNLDQLDRDLIELEKDPESSELLGRIFRAIHTVKGTSGVLGFAKLESVAHVGENLLSKMRDGKLRLNAQITTGLLGMMDAIREVLRAIKPTSREGDGDYTQVIAALKQLLESQAERPPIGQILIEQTHEAVQEALEAQRAGDERKLGEILVDRGTVSPQLVQEALQAQQSEAVSLVSGSSIRVDVNLLDKLMNLVGELVLARKPDPAIHRNGERLDISRHRAAVEPDHNRAPGRRDGFRIRDRASPDNGREKEGAFLVRAVKRAARCPQSYLCRKTQRGEARIQFSGTSIPTKANSCRRS